tara:strand:- start:195 stop:371 length:177 start_codon:yes stop_codon:yes gene_type:complete
MQKKTQFLIKDSINFECRSLPTIGYFNYFSKQFLRNMAYEIQLYPASYSKNQSYFEAV